MSLRLLVVGASGFLGSHVMQYCRQTNTDASGSASRQHGSLLDLDITHIEDVKNMIAKVKPTCVINCAAMTNVDECEKQPEIASKINALGPRNLAEVCSANRIRLVHVSTDSVFDGNEGGYSETSEPNPVNTYALTKLEGERFVSSLCKNHVIVRTNLYGLNPLGKGLLNWILANITEGKEITGFVDVIFNPLWANDLAELLAKLSGMQYTGIVNCAGDEVFSKYEFAKQVAQHLGYGDAKIRKGMSSDQQGSLTAKRPKNTTLKNDKMKELLNTKIHTLVEVLHGPSFDVYRSKEAKKI